jgi:PAS domain S-box-containing protein
MSNKPTYEELEQKVKQLEQDVIKHKQAEEDFKKAYEELERKVEERASDYKKLKFEDISKRKNIEETLRESEIHLSTLINTLPDLVWLKDKDGVYLSCNARFERFFGAKKANIIGKTDYDFVEKELADFFRERDKNAMRAAKPSVNEEEITFANDGHQELLETIKTPMFDSEGKLIGVLGIGRDITERKQAEEGLKKAHEELERKVEERTLDYKKAKEAAELANKLKSEFMANITHELRTPMHHISGYAHVGIKRLKTHKEKTPECFENIISASKRMMELVNNLLDLSRQKAGKMEYIFAENDVLTIINQNVSRFSHLIEKKGISIVINQPIVPTKIICDQRGIRQVIQNLLSNAIKFSPKSKNISIFFDSKKLPYSGKFKDKLIILSLIISIKDKGPGIPKKELEFIFDRFFQSSKTKTGAGGTGLGLAICKEIIETHNGKIWAENNHEGGATFSFMLPYEQKTNWVDKSDQEK